MDAAVGTKHNGDDDVGELSKASNERLNPVDVDVMHWERQGGRGEWGSGVTPKMME